MPGFLLHVGAAVSCPHGGQVTIMSTNVRVMVSGQPVATAADTYAVAGCAFSVGPKPQPCLKLIWTTPATRVLIGGQPAILQASAGICQSAELAPQGPPIVGGTQIRARGM